MILIHFVLLIFSFFSITNSNSIYIESYHISYNEGYEMTFLSLESDSIIGEGGKNNIALTKGDTILSCINNLEESNENKIDLYHVSSVILDESMLKKEPLYEFINMIKNNKICHFNFNLFISNDDPNKLYSFKNLDKDSQMNTLLDVASFNHYLFNFVSPVHFTKFVTSIIENKTLLIPSIKSEKIWDELNIYIDGLYYLNQFNFKYFDEKKCSILALLNKNNSIMIEDTLIKRYKIKYSYKDTLTITLKGKTENKEKKGYDKDLYLFLINNKEYDLLNLNYLNRILNKNYALDRIKIINKIN